MNKHLAIYLRGYITGIRAAQTDWLVFVAGWAVGVLTWAIWARMV